MIRFDSAYKDEKSRFLENTFDIAKDVDILFNLYLKNLLSDFRKGTYSEDLYNDLMFNNKYIIGKTTTDILVGEDCKRANIFNNVSIV